MLGAAPSTPMQEASAMIQMQAPYQPPRSPETHPLPAAPSVHNVAANTSLACALLWVGCFFVTPIWIMATNTAIEPEWLSTLAGFGLFVLPPVGIITGLVGLVRSFTRPLLHASRWPAIVGLLFGCLWLAATLVL
jgi:hypothetical protein